MLLEYGKMRCLKLVETQTQASRQTKMITGHSLVISFGLNGGAECWKKTNQSTVAVSTTEAECVAALKAAKKDVWIRKFLAGLGVIPSITEPMALYCNNNGAIAQAKEPRSHQKSKQIERGYHLIRDVIDRGDVEISKVFPDDNVADPLTKPLPRPKHESYTVAVGIKVIKMES